MVEIISLQNGATLLLEQIEGFQSASVGFFVQAGSRYETPEQAGISHFVEHMLFKGTDTRTGADIAREFDCMGGQVNAYTSKEVTCFYAKTLDYHAGQAVELLGDMLLHPRLDAGDMNTERGVVLEEIHMVEDSPDDLVVERLFEAAWGTPGLGSPILGTKQTVSSFSPEDLRAYMGEAYCAGNIVVSVAGRFDRERMVTLLRGLLERKYAVAVLAGTRRAAEALARDLQRDGFSATALDGPCDDAAPGTVAVLEGHLSAGADYPFARLAVFTGRRPGQQPAKKAKAKNKGLSSLTDIQPGDYVVHQNHGISLYAGIQRLDLQGVVKDYLKIRYEKGDTLRARHPAGPAQPVHGPRRQRPGEAVQTGRRKLEQDQEPGAQGHPGDGQGADRAVRPPPAGPGLRLPRGRRVAAGL